MINRPVDPDCDHRGYTGCTSCGCSECGALVDRETMGPHTLPSGQIAYACQACLAEGAKDAVPVAVDEEPTKAERTPTDEELMAERLSPAVNAAG